MTAEIPHNRLTFGRAEVEAVAAAVESGRWAAGPRVAALEEQLAERAGVAQAVCVASGLAALRLSLRALGAEPGARVGVPAYSCVALADAALACGAEVAPVDVRDADWNIDPALAAREGLDVVVAVHTFGAPSAIESLRSSGLRVVEDCAHAFGADLGGAPLGSRGDVSILSLHATKLVAAGEGGAVMTNSSEIAESVRAWRDYADRPASPDRSNNKLTDLEAALGLAQLDRLDAMLDERRRLAHRYLELLEPHAEAAGARLPAAVGDRIWYRFAVEMVDHDAEDVIGRMAAAGVRAASPVTDWREPGAPPAPVADRAYRSVVSLPLYPTLSRDEQETVIRAFLAAARV